VNHGGDFHAYYLRRIGVAAPIAEALSRKGQGSAFVALEGVAASAVVVGSSLTPQTASAPAVEPVVAPTVSSAPVQMPQPPAVGDLGSLRVAASRCTACALSQSRMQVVFGVGSEHPDVLFIGEAPGEQEDAQGEPFVGRAGQLLDRMLGALSWSRDNVYIMNVIKCRPPGNRDPHPEEVHACSHWFDAQWDLLKPRVVCLLGRVAAQRVLQTDATLASLRGRWHEYRGVPVWVTYHPAYLLRTPTGKAAVWQDLRRLAQRCEALKA